jgi:hypothetical protein
LLSNFDILKNLYLSLENIIMVALNSSPLEGRGKVRVIMRGFRGLFP